MSIRIGSEVDAQASLGAIFLSSVSWVTRPYPKLEARFGGLGYILVVSTLCPLRV
jgi:hypothetical protein